MKVQFVDLKTEIDQIQLERTNRTVKRSVIFQIIESDVIVDRIDTLFLSSKTGELTGRSTDSIYLMSFSAGFE